MGEAEDRIRQRQREAAEREAAQRRSYALAHEHSQSLARQEAKERRDRLPSEIASALQRVRANDYQDGEIFTVRRQEPGIFRRSRTEEIAGWPLLTWNHQTGYQMESDEALEVRTHDEVLLLSTGEIATRRSKYVERRSLNKDPITIRSDLTDDEVRRVLDALAQFMV